ncbi:MAG TPA: hypothetical protein PKC28_10940, partial [Bdellovibrionales bacterium]|nr:hypothetical protein [Bdellovibrionales bacterium]
AAAASLNFQIPVSLAVWVAASLFIMGLINLATSFSLSLFLAIKSRRIKFSQTPQLLALLGRRLRQRPLEFLLPLRDPP